MTSTLMTDDNFEDFDDFTEQLDYELLEKGRNLSDVEYANGSWIAVLNDGPDSTWSTNPDVEELEGQIEARWEQGYKLTDVEYGDGVWFASFEKGISSDSNYTYTDDPDEFAEQIQELGDGGLYRGYDFVDVEYGDGVWFGVLNDGLGGSTYRSANTDELLATNIEDLQEQGYDLVDVEYTGGGWVSVFYDDSGVVDSDYAIGNSASEFGQQIEQKLDEGYDLVDIEYGNGTWVGVFDGVIAGTDSNSDSTPSVDQILIDGTIDSFLRETYPIS